ncbi:DNA translocase FtsK 4TM domain-containing protein [Bdellovibrionota bacterium FG-2]
MESRQNSSKANGKSLGVEGASILVFALGVFTLCAMLTFHPSDPSLFTSTHVAVQNACGRVGAYLAAALLQCFGMGSFLLPAALFFIASSIHRREGGLRVFGTLGGMSVAVMGLTVFLGLQWKYWPLGGSLLLTGGIAGTYVAEGLLKQFNPLGSSIVSLLAFCLAFAFATPFSVARAGARVLKAMGILGFALSKGAFRILRLAGAYAIYFIGILFMRTAHALGDGIQKLFEAALRKARERRETVLTTKVTQVAIPSEGVIELESAPLPPPALMPPLTTSEAPNVFPELEKSQSRSVGSSSSKEPEILAHDHTKRSADVVPKSAIKSRRGAWKLPTIEFLSKPPKTESLIDKDRLLKNSKILEQKFADFGIGGEVVAVRPGPVITLYEFRPGPGVKVSRIAALADDLSMALSAQSVRILAPLPGKSVVGIEIPSDHRETVFMREFLQQTDFQGSRHQIPLVMGKDIGGQPFFSDLGRMPHLLCAGQTGSGKSVFMNGLICSLFYRFTPDELRMILVDPKFIEFRSYQDVPHLLLPVVDDAKEASTALKWAVREMDRRYRILAKIGAKNLAGFNQKVQELGADAVHDLLLSEEEDAEMLPIKMNSSDWMEAFEPDEQGVPQVGKLPYIVIIIDELADLMMIARKEVEISIARIAQKARAAGIHLVVATQRPSTDVITGLIKANLPSRVSFQLASYVDSKTILDRAGAERLLGQGDMLFIPPGVSQSVRLHGAYLTDDEINKVTGFLKSQGKPNYRNEILLSDDEDEESGGDAENQDDELFGEAVELVKNSGHASASYLQRHFKVGYNRAARLIEKMENRGIVGPADGARPREVLMR